MPRPMYSAVEFDSVVRNMLTTFTIVTRVS